MPQKIQIHDEEETDRGWSYVMELAVEGQPRRVRVLLSFVDHDHLSGGRVPPHQVATAVLELLAEARGVDDLPTMFDVSTARRLVPNLTEAVHERIGGGAVG